jgi:hypothetical protein
MPIEDRGAHQSFEAGTGRTQETKATRFVECAIIAVNASLRLNDLGEWSLSTFGKPLRTPQAPTCVFHLL